MAQTIWKGAISFGLVNIPIALFTAESRQEMDFHLLEKKSLAPIGYKKINKATGEEVRQDEIVRGYEYEKGRYVVLSDGDFRRANIKATQTIEILDFVDKDEIHPVYFDKPYYLAPAARGEKGYALLRAVLKDTGRAGIARVVIRSREYIGAVMPMGKVLVLNLLRYAYELRDPSRLEVPDEDLEKAGVSEKEFRMAEGLVAGMAAAWEPERYRDTYRDDLAGYISRKIESGETEAAPEPAAIEEAPAAGKVIDLMELLKKSMETVKAKKDRKAASG